MPINVGMIYLQRIHHLAGVEYVLITQHLLQMRNASSFKKDAELMAKDVLKIQNYVLITKEHKLSVINLQVTFQIQLIDHNAITQFQVQMFPIASLKHAIWQLG